VSTKRDLLKNALLELNVFSPVDVDPSSDDLAFAESKFNRMTDQWNARNLMAFNRSFKSYTLTANHQPHLIGPGLASPDFDTGVGQGGSATSKAVRPVKIYAAAIIFNNVTPNVTKPIPVVDDDWWAENRVKSLTTSVPTALYYSPDFPNGSLYLWPVPNFAYGLELEWRTAFSALTLTDTLSLPPGYEEALTLSLAEALIPTFPDPQRDDAGLRMQASKARAIIESPNSKAPRMATKDAGMPSSNSGSGARGDFNYYSGGPR
jgi:hypothetical protein